jgi:class 3 adenylate cyclase/predicted ATPase
VPGQGEHRQITAVFCDIVGSTRLAGELGAEEMHAVVQRFRVLCADAVARFDGVVSRYMGDGVLIYFGYPAAHEDDAERAVRAGLDIQRCLAEARSADGYPVHARIGIATGSVVVSELASGELDPERTVLGNALNLAARVQDCAGADGVAIGPLTRRLLGELFLVEDLGEQPLKGFDEPVAIHRIIGEADRLGRFQAQRAAGGLGHFVGRGWELDLLHDRWDHARAGDGQVVLVSGEAGIGKSRLIEQLSLRVRANGGNRILLSCTPYHGNTPFQPVVAQLTHEGGLEASMPAAERLARLRGVLGPLHGQDPTALTLCARLLSVPTEGLLAPLGLTAQQQRRRTQEVLIEVLAERARACPVLLVCEDAHWIDPSTNELIERVAARCPGLQLLLVITARPEYRVGWADLPHVASLMLSRLDQRHAVEIAEGAAGGKSLPGVLIEEILKRTDGVPLFVEELTKNLVESGVLVEHPDRFELAGALPSLTVPSTLRDSLTARLDRLGDAKAVAQAGAVIGRSFGCELLAEVAGVDRGQLAEAMARLVGAGLIVAQGDPPDAIYTFKHALVQDTAYRSMLTARRKALHGRIAEVIESRFPETREQEPEVLARHWLAAGDTARALDYLESAGMRGLARSSYVEGIASLRQALELLERMDPSPERLGRELRLQTALGGALIATRGFAAGETGAAYARAAELCGLIGETTSLYPVRYGVFVFHLVRGELARARELAREFVKSAEAHEDPAHHLAAHRTLGSCLTFMGEWRDARQHLDRALDLYDRGRHAGLAVTYAQDPRISALALKSWLVLQQGRFDDALALSDAAVSEAQAFEHLHTLAYALGIGGIMVPQFCRDLHGTREAARALSELCRRQPVPLWGSLAFCLEGWCIGMNGDIEAGIRQLTQGYNDFVATGARLFRPYYNTLIADLHLAGGDPKPGLERLELAQQQMQDHHEGWFAAELDCRHADALRTAGDTVAAEARYHRGLTHARAQHGLLSELRLSVGLATLLRDRGDIDAARGLLEPLTGRFEQGFERPDLVGARRLLATLGRN